MLTAPTTPADSMSADNDVSRTDMSLTTDWLGQESNPPKKKMANMNTKSD